MAKSLNGDEHTIVPRRTGDGWVNPPTVPNRPAAGRDVAALFLRWTYLRAVFGRGYWTVASLYLVVDAHLSPFQLLLLGTFMGITLVLSDIPTGVWSDAIGRKWPLVDTYLSAPAWL